MTRIGCGSARRGICIGSRRERLEAVVPKRNLSSRPDARCRPKGLEWLCCSTEPRPAFPPESEYRKKSAGPLSFGQSTQNELMLHTSRFNESDVIWLFHSIY